MAKVIKKCDSMSKEDEIVITISFLWTLSMEMYLSMIFVNTVQTLKSIKVYRDSCYF